MNPKRISPHSICHTTATHLLRAGVDINLFAVDGRSSLIDRAQLQFAMPSASLFRATLRQASPGADPGAQIGAISFLHRFGSSLNAHFHFHVCVIDGVFSEDAEGSVQFHEATHLTASHWNELQHKIRHRGLR